MQRLLLIANPAASGFTAAMHRQVVATLRHKFDVTPIWPAGPTEAETSAAAAAGEGYAVVAAMGGDGIVHRVANGIAGTAACLAVIPAGTGNVFARITGYPRRGTAAAEAVVAATRVIDMPTIRVDAVGRESQLTRTALFAVGVGYDADVIQDSERRPLRKVGAGTIHYTRSAVGVALRRYRNRAPDLTVTVDGDRTRAVTVIAQVYDRFTFLGRRGMSLSPKGGPAAITLHRATPGRLMRLVARSARRRDPGRVSGVTLWHPFGTLEVVADGTVGLEADGEYLGEMVQVRLTVITESLRLLDPRSRPKGARE